MKRKQNNNIPLSKVIIEELPYIKQIRASWIANISHCKKESPCSRDTLTKYNIEMCKEWSGEVGFLRYYIWHIDNGYIAGKSKIQRKDMTKGFSPDNCFVVTEKNRPKGEKRTRQYKLKDKNKADDNIKELIIDKNLKNISGLNLNGIEIASDGLKIIISY